jgi:hypothetical protein
MNFSSPEKRCDCFVDSFAQQHLSLSIEASGLLWTWSSAGHQPCIISAAYLAGRESDSLSEIHPKTIVVIYYGHSSLTRDQFKLSERRA